MATTSKEQSKKLARIAARSVASFLTGFAVQAPADVKPQFLWSNSQGLVQASQCKESLQANTPFAIVVTANPIKIGGKTVKGRELVTVQVDNKVRGQKLLKTIDSAEQGYAKENLVFALDEYVLETKKTGQKLRTTGGQINLDQAFWQAAMTEDKFKTISCTNAGETKNYLIFEVFTAESMDSIATVAVTATETQIFQNVIIDNSEEAEAKLGGETVDEGDVADDGMADPVAATADTPAAIAPAKKADSKLTTNQAEKSSLVIPTPRPNNMLTTAPANTPAQTPAVVNVAQGTAATKPTGTTSTAATEVTPTTAATSETKAVVDVPTWGSLDYVVCSNKKSLRVRDDQLKKVLFTVDGLDEVKLVQSWGKDTQEATISGKKMTFVKVQVPDEDGDQEIGWIASDFIKEKSQCNLVKKEKEVVNKADPVNTKSKISGISDKNCCTFPLFKRPTDSYKSGMRRFRASRSRGRRLHAACDLYSTQRAPIRAVANGKILRNLYLFYQGVYALEVRHEGGFVVRYGEIISNVPRGVKAGLLVKAGQTLGYVGRVNSGCCKPMLHFEVYSGKSNGALSQLRRRPMQRRADVMNPTDFLSKWERRQFGVSY